MKPDAVTITAELEGIAAQLYAWSNYLLELEQNLTPTVMGQALHAIADHLERITADVGEGVKA